MDALTTIRRLHEHRCWCNENLRRAAADLSEGQMRKLFDIGQGSLLATLVHLYGAEHAWLEVLNGKADAPLPQVEAFESVEQLFVAWRALDRRWERYLQNVHPSQLSQSIRRTNSKGQSRVTPMSDVLLHVCTHAQYTTAQAVNMMRHLGVDPLPETMLITLSRSEHN